MDRPQLSRTPRRALLALLIANLALACGPWLVRLAESDARVGPLGSAFWRMALALPVLIAVSARRRDPLPARWGGVTAIAALSGLFFAADLALWHLGILRTRLANATLFGNITAILFPLYGFLVARAWPNARQAAALALAAIGAILLLGRSYHLSAQGALGDLLCLLAGGCYTGYLIAIERTRGRLGPLPTLTVSVLAGTPLLLIVALAAGEPLRPHDWTPLILLTLGSQLIGQGLILYAVARLAPLVVGVMLLIQPIVSAGIGWSVYGERLGLLDVIGGAGIAIAVLLVRDGGGPLSARAERLKSRA